MNYLEIEQLVYEDEIEQLNNLNNVNSKLIELEKNKEFRKDYFGNDLSKYNSDTLNKLRKNYQNELAKIDRLELLFNILNNLPLNLDKLSNMIDDAEVSAKIKKEELQSFKQDLAYLLYLNEISKAEAIKRGFSLKEINRMRRKCLREKELAYESYLNSNDLDTENVKVKRY